jgi:3D (Asp-Asp-Asp) domain-containing protein
MGRLPNGSTDMLLSRSLRRKVLATALAAVAFVLVYQAATNDSRPAASVAIRAGRAIEPGTRVDFVGTAYCKGDTTASGVIVKAGIAAADPSLLPEGSVIAVEGVPERYRGIYTVMDTGPMIQGRHVDLYMWSCTEALEFGRRDLTLLVLRLGWNPKNSKAGIH